MDMSNTESMQCEKRELFAMNYLNYEERKLFRKEWDEIAPVINEYAKSKRKVVKVIVRKNKKMDRIPVRVGSNALWYRR